MIGLTRALNGVLAVAVAPQCAACQRVLDAPLDGPVCAACWNGIVPVRAPLAGVDSEPIQSWRAAGEYEGSLREIIHAFKYDGRESLARPLATLMRHAGADVLRDADFVVPVPLHPWRRFTRGFNQAEELARGLDVPMCRALWRTRVTAPQSGLRPAQRRRNVRAAFRTSPFLRASRLKDARVVLVDDVRTTGATLDSCARALAEAGVLRVTALTVARAALPRR